MTAAKAFFRGALEVAGEAPERLTTDGHDAYPRAIREELGETVLHRTNRTLNNWIEQDHRGINTQTLEREERRCHWQPGDTTTESGPRHSSTSCSLPELIDPSITHTPRDRTPMSPQF